MENKIRYLTCGYCSTGCNMIIKFDDKGKPIVRANLDYPVNQGKACPKGFQLLSHLNVDDRATTPYIRDHENRFIPITWEAALQEFVGNFKRIQNNYGKNSIAFISTGQITNEEHAFLGALAKFGMGMIHGDGNTRQCMATSVVAYKQSFGWDAPPFTYEDLEKSDVMIFFGSNAAISHPVIWWRIQNNLNDPTVVVIDPRKTETATDEITSLYYPIKAKSELYLLYTIANILIQNNWVDGEFVNTHTSGFKEFKKHIAKYTLESTARKTGISEEQISKLAEIIHKGKAVSFWWMVGVNQAHQGTRTAQALINLALMTGNIGKPGTGPNSITGQCNAMGARIFSNTTALLGGYDFTKESDRNTVAKILGIDSGVIPHVNSASYEKILEKIKEGKIKGLWVVCTNPAHSWINSNEFPEIVENLEYLVVQDMYYTTETAQLANLILPAAGTGEKDGTFVNSERRIGLLQKVLDPPGEALSDFDIFNRVADTWGCSHLFKRWTNPESAFQVIKKLTKGKPWDFSGIESYQMILDHGGIQWPYPSSKNKKTDTYRRLFDDGVFYHEDGKAQFLYDDILPYPEEINQDYPFILITGRGNISTWHTHTRTGKVPLLARKLPKDPYIEISTTDAKNLGIEENQWVQVSSRRDKIKVKALIGGRVKEGEVFMPMHYKETNKLTFPIFDEYSREPGYKFAAVQVKKDFEPI
ncbi:MAG: molybdopterin oxidoreductase family protein [Candidatus Lokiarchaeota archaeon]|nr:molybdopterin oxidoreductase family protein [Candidatus Lokiarchaeota archaeon]